VLAGLWLARRLAPRRVAGLACAGLALLVVVNVSGCPPQQDVRPLDVESHYRPVRPMAQGAKGSLEGEAGLEVSSAENGIELVIDRDQFEKLAKAGEAPASR